MHSRPLRCAGRNFNAQPLMCSLVLFCWSRVTVVVQISCGQKQATANTTEMKTATTAAAAAAKTKTAGNRTTNSTGNNNYNHCLQCCWERMFHKGWWATV